MKAPYYPVPEKGYLSKPGDQSCYEYLLECYAKVSKDIGDYTAFVNLDCETKVSQMIADVEKLAAFLNANGFKKGDVITVFLPTSAHAFIAFYALSKLGIICNMAHPLLPPDAIKEILDITKSKAIFILDRAAGAYAKVLKDIFTIVCSTSDYTSGPIKPYVVADDAKNSNIPDFDTIHLFRDIMAGEYEPAETVRHLGKQTMIYLGGGGTTGRSKIIQHSSYAFNYLAYLDYLLDNDCVHPYGESYNLCVLPCFHAFGLGSSMHYAVCNAYSCILMPKFDPEKANDYISRYNVQEILGVPNMFKKMIEADNFDNPGVKNLDYISCGGDTVTKEFRDEFTAKVKKNGGHAHLLSGYGLTETCAIATTNSLSYNKNGSVGLPVNGVEVIVVDENKKEVPAGVIGEILVRGEVMMNGYLDDGYVENDGIWKDENGVGWVCTGDAGFLDEDGYLFIAGRIKRIIIISGYNVYPATVEQKVMLLDYVNEACAVQGYDDNGKICVKLCVSLNDGSLDHEKVKKDLIDYCEKNLDHFSVPRKIEILETLPRTKMDKIDFMAMTEKAPLAKRR